MADSPSLALITAPATVEQDFSKACGPLAQGAGDAASLTTLPSDEALHSAKSRACSRHLSARDAKEFATTSGRSSAWPTRKDLELFTLALRQAAVAAMAADTRRLRRQAMARLARLHWVRGCTSRVTVELEPK